MKKLRFKSLRARLTFWFLAVTMLSLATAGTVLYFQRAAVIRGNEFEKLQIVRDLKVNALNQWLDERMDDLAVSAGDDEVRSLEEILVENGSERDSKKVLVARALLQRYLDNYGAYSELFIVSATSGKVVISTDLAQEGKDKQTDLYFTEPMRTKKAYIKDIFYSEIEKRPTMVFSAPIFSLVHGGEHLVGVLVARVNLERSLYPLLQNRTGMGETGETLIVNKDGVALNELRWYENAPLKLKISAQPSVRGAAGKTGIIEDLDYRGEMVLAAYTHIPRIQWGFVAKRDLAEVYAPIHDMLQKLLLVFGFTALVVTLVSLLLSKTISRPIIGVGDAVRRFANGELDARCSINGTDEVADLGAAFNEMVATLSSQMAIRKGYAELSETLVIADKIKDFASGLLMKLIDLSGSHLGAFYLRSENGAVFEQIASVGLSGDTPQSFSAEGYEGELGQAIATGQISLVREISADTVFTFKTTGGTAIPQEILTVPLLVGRQVIGVVSLATLSAFPDTFRQILDLAQIGMGTAFSNLLASVKTQRLAEELRTNNTELQAQAVEMEQQAQELQQQAVELEAQQQQVEAANRLKSEFLSNMSHELRTPLNSVLSLSQLMLSNGIGSRGGEDKERVEIIERNGRHLLNLINDILDISKIEAGRMDLYVSSFAVEETVEAVVEAIRPLANQKGVSISVEVGALGELQTDQDKLKQILLNLLSNAQKFTEKGEIGIKARQDGRSVVISVWDTGIGIPEQALSHIFDEFRQADGSTTRQYGGTGLGLTISRRLAALLGGRIDVESEEGTGSTFTLTLPMHIEVQAAHVETYLRTLINTIPDLVWLKNPEGVYISCNSMFETLYGAKEEAIVGKTDYAFVSKEVADCFRDHDRKAMEAGGTSVNEEHLTFVGTGYEGEFETIKTPMYDSKGKLIGVLGVARDITERKQAAAALQASEKRFRNVAESMSDWVWEVNADGIYTFSSSNIKTSLGYQEAEILGKTPFDFMPADEAKRVGALFGEIVRDKRGFRDLENWNLTKDGRRICLLTSGTPIFGDDGELLGYRGVDSDITERKQAEAALRESELQFRNLSNAGSALLWTSGSDKLCNYFNNIWLKFTGRTLEQELGNGWVEGVHPDDVDRCFKTYVTAFDQREPFEMEYRLRNASGEYRVILDLGTPNFNSKAEFIGYIGHCFDITERKQAEAEKERFLTAIDQVEETIVITDVDGTIQHVNPAFEMVSGYTCEEAIGQNPRILQSGEHDDTFYQQMWNTLLRGETWSGRIVNKKKDGTLYTEEAVISPVKDGFGKTVNYVAVKRNVTEELKREEQFRQSQKMEAIGQLAGGVAHDFNNILQAILGYSEILLGRLNEGTQEHRDVAEIKKSASCAADLTRQLLTFSRKQPLEKKSVNLNAFIEDTQGMIKMMLEGNIIPVLDLAQDLPLVSADAGQLSQIIMNLSVNARDAMPNGGQLTFKTENIQFSPDAASAMPGAVAGDFVCLAVTDTGYGMSQQVKDHLFEPFFTTKGIGKGTGLGLSVLYGIVKQHNGWIAVDSEEGRGTTFKIYLPVCSTKACASAAQHAPESEPKHEHILLVEDDPNMRKMVIELLQSAEYQVSEAESAEEALALFNSEPEKFDLLFSDIVMPGQNGIELADVIRQKKPALPVLLYSGYMNPHERWGNFDSKGYRFLQKPFTITTLLMAVYEALADVNQPE